MINKPKEICSYIDDKYDSLSPMICKIDNDPHIFIYPDTMNDSVSIQKIEDEFKIVFVEEESTESYLLTG